MSQSTAGQDRGAWAISTTRHAGSGTARMRWPHQRRQMLVIVLDRRAEQRVCPQSRRGRPTASRATAIRARRCRLAFADQRQVADGLRAGVKDLMRNTWCRQGFPIHFWSLCVPSAQDLRRRQSSCPVRRAVVVAGVNSVTWKKKKLGRASENRSVKPISWPHLEVTIALFGAVRLISSRMPSRELSTVQTMRHLEFVEGSFVSMARRFQPGQPRRHGGVSSDAPWRAREPHPAPAGVK